MTQTEHTNPRNKRSRINNDYPWKETTIVNSNINMLEAHVHAVNTRRIQEALLAEHIRIAQANRPGIVSKIIANVRLSTGMILITSASGSVTSRRRERALPRHKTNEGTSNTMDTSILLQHIRATQLDGERLQKSMQSEQLRIARATRPSIATQIRTTIGIMLISLGERLHQAPATRATTSSRGRTATRTA